jgi:glycosyltransferase involved in cell wall biosynthesis
VTSKPEVTVVIPTRDRRRRLAATLASVLRQRDVDLEVIVVDDGSMDGTAESVMALGDPRIRVVRREHAGGPAKARNAGIGAARGGWIAFLDDDDLWAPGKLRRQLDTARTLGASWCYCAAAHIDEQARVLFVAVPPGPATLAAALQGRNPVPAGASNVIVETALLRRLHGFDEGLSHFADWDMWIRLTASGRAAVVDAPLVGYMQHLRNMRGQDSKSLRLELRRLDAKHHRSVDPADPERAILLRWIAEGYLGSGERLAAARLYLSLAVRTRSARDLFGLVESVIGLRARRSVRALRAAGTGRASDAGALAWLRDCIPEDRPVTPAGGPALSATRRLGGRPGWLHAERWTRG